MTSIDAARAPVKGRTRSPSVPRSAAFDPPADPTRPEVVAALVGELAEAHQAGDRGRAERLRRTLFGLGWACEPTGGGQQ